MKEGIHETQRKDARSRRRTLVVIILGLLLLWVTQTISNVIVIDRQAASVAARSHQEQQIIALAKEISAQGKQLLVDHKTSVGTIDNTEKTVQILESLTSKAAKANSLAQLKAIVNCVSVADVDAVAHIPFPGCPS